MSSATIIQVILAVLLTASILIQQRGAGLSGAFGGEGGVYSTRRGAEKFVFAATIVLAALFFGFSIARLILQR